MLASRLALVFLAGCAFGCGADSVTTDCGTAGSVQSKSDNGSSFCISLQEGIEVRNIVLLREPIGGKRILQFRQINGLEVRRGSSEPANSGEQTLSVEEFADLLSSTLDFVHSEFDGQVPDSVQMDLKLVEETWRTVVSAVGEQIPKLAGPVVPKAEAVDTAALHGILTSRLVEQVCEVVRASGRNCADHVSLNPIAFEESVVGSSWNELKEVSDYGLSESIWFGVTIEGESAR